MAETTDNDSYRVVRSIDIDAPADAIYPHLVDFHEWKAWSPWEDIDPNLWRGYSGEPAGVGAIYEWSGNRKAGAGRMEIVEATAPDAVSVTLQFLKPFKSSSVASFTLAPDADRTRVTWTMRGPKTFTTRLMGLFFTNMDKVIGPDFEKGLGRLKVLAES